MTCRKISFSLRFIRYEPSFSKCFILFKNYSKNSPPRNLYEVLGLKNTSSTKDVKKAYIKLCKELHPDMKPGDGAQHKKFVELNNAYSVLVNEASRRKYDNAVNETMINDNFHFKKRSSENSANPFYNSTAEKDAWYDRDIYKQERDYFRQQRKNAHVTFQNNQSRILGGCFLLVVVGYLLYYAAYSHAKNTLKRVDARSKKIRESYDATVKKSGESGREKIFERWKKRLNPPEE